MGSGGKFRQFLLAGEGIERGGCRGGGILRSAKRRYVVFVVNREGRHVLSPWCHTLRGHHMNHSEVLEKQGDCAINRRWRRHSDGRTRGRRSHPVASRRCT